MTLDTPDDVDNNANIEVATPLSDSVTDVPHGDSFSFTDFLTLEHHVELLKQRGLTFKNIHEELRFQKLINTVGYYRLSQYFKHFYTTYHSKQFITDIKAKQIITAYKQNERLRILLIDALLKLESKLRTLLTEELILATRDVYWCYEPSFAAMELVSKATRTRTDRKTHQESYTEQSTRLFFEHYPKHKRIPAWVAMQSQEFGTLCQLLKHRSFPKRILKSMVGQFALPKEQNYNSLYPIFDALRHLRNLCVHHEKLIGEQLRIAPPLWNGLHPNLAHSLPNFLFWIERLLQSVTVRDSFANELREIIQIVNRDCPQSMHIAVYRPSSISEP